MNRHVALWLLAVAACDGSEVASEWIAIPANDLGAVAIRVDKYEHEDDSLFELRGLDAGDREVALVRKRVGTIEDLPDSVDKRGSELILSAGGEEIRTISAATTVRRAVSTDLPVMQRFLELDEVSSTLEARGQIIVVRAGSAAEQAYTAESCPASYMSTSPVAAQCCFSTLESTGDQYTLHLNTSGHFANQFVRRWRGPACSSSGGGSCVAGSCYYGPLGFSVPEFFAGGSNPRVRATYIWSTGDYRCHFYTYASNPPPIQFADVTGTNAPGRGCFGGGGSGGAGTWDY